MAEYLLAACVVASFGWVVQFFYYNHYLPQPFLFVPEDTFMDWFNTAYWANHAGAHTVWHSVYPPISFTFLQIFSTARCYESALGARDCDLLGQVTIAAFYLGDCFLCFHFLRRVDPATAIPRSIAFAIGLPLLFCLERGNLVIVCLPLFMLAYSGLSRSIAVRAIAIAITINFKPYLLLQSFAFGLKRNWRALELAGLATLMLYMATLAQFGSGDPFQILDNLGLWAQFTSGIFWEQFFFSNTFSSLLLLKTSNLPILSFLTSRFYEGLMWWLPPIIGFTQCAALLGLAAAWLQPNAISLPRVAALITGAHLATQWVGGYAITFLIFLVFLEPERRFGQTIALICAYLLSVSYDWILVAILESTTLSWLSGYAVHAKFGLSIGQFIRPALILIIVWALAWDTIVEVIRAHRHHRPSLGLVPA